jgi:hypothetical protein
MLVLAWRSICLYIIHNSSLPTFDDDGDNDNDGDGDDDGFCRYLPSWMPC